MGKQLCTENISQLTLQQSVEWSGYN